MAAPNLDPRFIPQQHQQNYQQQQYNQAQQQQQQQQYYPPPPPSSRSGGSVSGAARQPRSPTEYPRVTPSPYPANVRVRSLSSVASADTFAKQYPPPPQGYFPQQDGYPPPPPPGSNHSQQHDPRMPRQANSQYAPSPQPSFSNQIAPFTDEKAQANYPASNFGPNYPNGSGPIPQYEYGGPDYHPNPPQYKSDRYRENDRDTSDSRSSSNDRERRHKKKKDRSEEGRSSRNPLSGLSDDKRNLGASMLGGAGGALVGHKLGGKLGATVGILVGAIGATKLEEKRERYVIRVC
ncbi:hypothetical protein K461DRAFT_277573 [Myriangium duriaei CBS 260.36]|uniref:Glycine zipper 2TM domain-containing protein n=1 Tax=Myriangium duriaei CBS 260.36 TaxID=1168546 RepID=A0A9P4J2V1_9PEZI|nr:hypothetical protein K461DRAFT_277573 [Myriangium duriaei CBS 260.36]